MDKAFVDMPPHTFGLALVVVGLIGGLKDSGALDAEGIAALSGRIEKAIFEADLDEEYRKGMLEITRYVLPDNHPGKSQP